MYRWVLLFILTVSFISLQRMSEGGPAVSDKDSCWQKTQLSLASVESFLSDSNCYQNRKNFLACANALAKAKQDQNILPIHPSQHLVWQLKMNEYKMDQFSFFNEYKKLENKLNGIPVESIRALAVNGYLSVDQDPHTYISPKNYAEVKSIRAESKMDPLKKTLNIEIAKMSPGICLDVREHLLRFQNEEIQKVTLDLSNNPGGLFDEAACIASLFVAAQTYLFELKYFDTNKKSIRYYSQGLPLFSGQLEVIVNWKTGSSAELLAGSFQELGRAVLSGEKTFGKASFQAPEAWNLNDQIFLFKTVGMMYLPSGITYQGYGIIPKTENKKLIQTQTILQEREADRYFNAFQREG